MPPSSPSFFCRTVADSHSWSGFDSYSDDDDDYDDDDDGGALTEGGGEEIATVRTLDFIPLEGMEVSVPAWVSLPIHKVCQFFFRFEREGGQGGRGRCT